jgi:hypothetical protein
MVTSEYFSTRTSEFAFRIDYKIRAISLYYDITKIIAAKSLI